MAQGQKRTTRETSTSKSKAIPKADSTAKGKASTGKAPSKTQAATSAKAATTGKDKAKKPAAAKSGKARKAAEPAQAKASVKLLAQTLLELHLQHELQRFQGERFIQEIRTEVAVFLKTLQKVTLNDWVTPEQVMGVIQRNVVDLKISGGVTELAGDMANLVYNSKAHRDTRLKEIMTARQFEEFVEKLLSLKSHRQRVVSQLLGHPVYAELVSKILYQGIVQYLSKTNVIGSNIPGVSAMFKFGKKMVDKAAPDLEANLEASLLSFIGKNMAFFIRQSETFLNETLSDQALKGTIMDFWDAIENKQMKHFQKGIDTLDLSEFVVLGYEFWLKYRKTEHFRHCCQVVVDGFFKKYGDQPLSVLLEEMGVTDAMILTEAEAFAPRIAELLHRNGYLEERLRARLESFYYSEAVQNQL